MTRRLRELKNTKNSSKIPKNPDPSRKIVGLMVETTHPQNRIVVEIPQEIPGALGEWSAIKHGNGSWFHRALRPGLSGLRHTSGRTSRSLQCTFSPCHAFCGWNQRKILIAKH